MAKLSIIIPSRNERFLIPTIEDVFKNARGEVEVIAVLEGYYPENWKSVTDKYPNLHTIHHSEPKGLRASINDGAASAISRGARYLAKFDAHCCFGEGFDEILKADCDKDWVVVPRRKRLDPDTFAPRTDGRPDIDYHYLSFPDDPQDFGGPGLNGKVWDERARQRFGKPEYDVDDEMSSQGSGWFMYATYFLDLELMDSTNYGQFWNEFQEIGLKCWLSGGQVKVNKKTWYAHWHKGSAGRGYSLPKEWLNQGATFTKRWLFNEAWAKQTLPFKTLIERFWPVPTWPENWEELVYGTNNSNKFVGGTDLNVDSGTVVYVSNESVSLKIHSAHYGIGGLDDIDVREVLQRKIVNNSLDICVTNADLEVGNPFRGQKKQLTVTYSYDKSEVVTITRQERDWFIIGQSARYVKGAQGHPPFFQTWDDLGKRLESDDVNKFIQSAGHEKWQQIQELPVELIMNPGDLRPDNHAMVKTQSLTTVAALNDFLIRRFNIPSHRLRGPMPIEIPTFHRNDLAKLFAELGFNRGAEIGVAEGKFSEVLCQANPELNLLCVDPWHSYKDNPQSKTKAKDEFAYNETKRRLAPYPNVKLDMRLSLDAVRDVADNSLDFVNIDGHHGFRFVMMDLLCWSTKVRSGGIILLDDYIFLDPHRWGAGVIEAVQAFTSVNRINPWFICNADRSVDAFFVKGDWK